MSMSTFTWTITVQVNGRQFTYHGDTMAPPTATPESILPGIAGDLPAEARGRDAQIVAYQARKTN